jgi:SM-20-related protein
VDAAIAESLATAGLAVSPDYWPADPWRRLAAEAVRLRARGGFRAAGVGRGSSLRVRPEIRGDHVHWIDPEAATRCQRAWLVRMEALRRALNARLYLGLFGFEGHLAVYPPGRFYKVHVDRFKAASHRVVSSVLYLNEAWQAEEGGALRIYPHDPEPDPEGTPHRDVLPTGGTLVTFLAADVHHEVLAATRERWSVVGWFVSRP